MLVEDPGTRWSGSGGEWGENVLCPSYWQPSQNPHAQGPLRTCKTILVIHSSWGDRVFFRPTGLGLTVWATYTHAHSHILSQHQGSIRPTAWVSRSYPDSGTANCIHTSVLTFLCEATGDGTHAYPLFRGSAVPLAPGGRGVREFSVLPAQFGENEALRGRTPCSTTQG